MPAASLKRSRTLLQAHPIATALTAVLRTAHALLRYVESVARVKEQQVRHAHALRARLVQDPSRVAIVRDQLLPLDNDPLAGEAPELVDVGSTPLVLEAPVVHATRA